LLIRAPKPKGVAPEKPRAASRQKAKPGQEIIEVIAFRGEGSHFRVAFVAFLETGDLKTSQLTFLRHAQSAILTGVQVTGKSFRLAPFPYRSRGEESAGLYQTIFADEAEPLGARD